MRQQLRIRRQLGQQRTGLINLLRALLRQEVSGCRPAMPIRCDAVSTAARSRPRSGRR
jgi:hypothetical protein